MNKIETLHAELIETLESHVAYFNAEMGKYSTPVTLASDLCSFQPTNARKYNQAAAYRLQVIKSLATIRAWSTDDFRMALHSNWRGIQSYVFQTN